MTLREQAEKFLNDCPTVEHALINKKNSDTLIDLYYKMTGQLISCGGCYNQAEVAYVSISNYIKRDTNPNHIFNLNRKIMQFKFNPNAQVYSNTLERFINERTLTDEIAVILIAERETNLNYFAGYPEDYADRVEAYRKSQPEVKVEAVEITMEQANELLSEEQPEVKAEEKPNNKPGKNNRR